MFHFCKVFEPTKLGRLKVYYGITGRLLNIEYAENCKKKNALESAAVCFHSLLWGSLRP